MASCAVISQLSFLCTFFLANVHGGKNHLGGGGGHMRAWRHVRA